MEAKVYIKNEYFNKGSHIDTTVEKRFGEEQRKRRQIVRENDKIDREKKLFQIKEKPFQQVSPVIGQLFGVNCNHCVPVKKSLDNHGLRKTFSNLFDLKCNDAGIRAKICNWISKTFYKDKFSKIIYHPAQIKWLTQTIEKNPGCSLIFVTLDDNKLDREIIKLVLSSFAIDFTEVVEDSDEMETATIEFLKNGKNLQLSISDMERWEMPKYLAENMQNVFLVPTSVNSEKISSKTVDRDEYGTVRINFCEPYLFKQLYDSLEKHESNDSMDLRIIRHLQIEMKTSMPIMATNVLAFLLLSEFRNGTTLQTLAERLRQFRSAATNKIDMNFVGDEMQIIYYASSIMGNDLIIIERHSTKENETIIRPNLQLGKAQEIHEYAKPLLPFFAGCSIVGLAVKSITRGKNGELDQQLLEELSMDLSDWFYYEQLDYKYCKSTKTLVNDWINELCYREILLKPVVVFTEDQQRAQKMARYFEDMNHDGDSDDSDDFNRRPDQDKKLIEICSKKASDLKTLTKILEPICEIYLHTIECLHLLVDVELMLETQFISNVLTAFETKFDMGIYLYADCASKEYVKNCLKALHHTRKIHRRKLNDAYVVRLRSEFNCHDKILAVAEEYEMYNCLLISSP